MHINPRYLVIIKKQYYMCLRFFPDLLWGYPSILMTLARIRESGCDMMALGGGGGASEDEDDEWGGFDDFAGFDDDEPKDKEEDEKKKGGRQRLK